MAFLGGGHFYVINYNYFFVKLTYKEILSLEKDDSLFSQYGNDISEFFHLTQNSRFKQKLFEFFSAGQEGLTIDFISSDLFRDIIIFMDQDSLSISRNFSELKFLKTELNMSIGTYIYSKDNIPQVLKNIFSSTYYYARIVNQQGLCSQTPNLFNDALNYGTGILFKGEKNVYFVKEYDSLLALKYDGNKGFSDLTILSDYHTKVARNLFVSLTCLGLDNLIENYDSKNGVYTIHKNNIDGFVLPTIEFTGDVVGKLISREQYYKIGGIVLDDHKDKADTEFKKFVEISKNFEF